MSRSVLIKVSVGMIYLMLMAPVFSFAQQFINGKIISRSDQSAVPSATILIKGTRSGTSSNIDGLFSIRVKKGDELVLNSVGVKSTEFTVDDQLSVIIDVEMDPKSMTAVLVTSLGIRKKSKRLGYSIQEVKGSELIKAREPNPVNGLAGKIAGLTVAPSAELLGVPALILRGNVDTLEMADTRIFDPAKAMKKYNKEIDWRKIMQGPAMDDEKHQRSEHYKGDD